MAVAVARAQALPAVLPPALRRLVLALALGPRVLPAGGREFLGVVVRLVLAVLLCGGEGRGGRGGGGRNTRRTYAQSGAGWYRRVGLASEASMKEPTQEVWTGAQTGS